MKYLFLINFPGFPLTQYIVRYFACWVDLKLQNWSFSCYFHDKDITLKTCWNGKTPLRGDLQRKLLPAHIPTYKRTHTHAHTYTHTHTNCLANSLRFFAHATFAIGIFIGELVSLYFQHWAALGRCHQAQLFLRL